MNFNFNSIGWKQCNENKLYIIGKLNGEPAISEKIFFLNQLSQNKETAVSISFIQPLFKISSLAVEVPSRETSS